MRHGGRDGSANTRSARTVPRRACRAVYRPRAVRGALRTCQSTLRPAPGIPAERSGRVLALWDCRPGRGTCCGIEARTCPTSTAPRASRCLNTPSADESIAHTWRSSNVSGGGSTVNASPHACSSRRMSSAVNAPVTTTDVWPSRRAVLMRAMCSAAAKVTPENRPAGLHVSQRDFRQLR
jgi:hypothetical protein